MKTFNLKISWLIFLTNFIKDGFCQDRIFGGTLAGFGEFPYHVSIQVWTNLDINVLQKLLNILLPNNAPYKWAHNCGGSIISKNCVLTAAHCVQPVSNVSLLSVCVETLNIDECSEEQRYFVKEYLYHQDYKPQVTSDIAVMIMEKSFDFGLSINEINFRDRTYVNSDVLVRLAGWGRTSDLATTSSKTLKKVDLITMSNQDCSRDLTISDTEICAKGFSIQGACRGDSGGSLVNEDKSNIVGIVSWGSGACASITPEVYTRVSLFVDWIDNIVQSNS